MRYLVALSTVALLVGCRRREPTARATSEPQTETGAIEDSPRNAQIINSINRIARGQFPGNAHNTWTIRAIDHDGDMSYVEAVPTPDDVGYPSLVFALHFKGEKEGRCVATYAMEEGKYTLLGSAPDFDGPLPKER